VGSAVLGKTDSKLLDLGQYLRRIERKKIKIYALHKTRIISLANYAMVKSYHIVYYI
jgi:hypothetical protein